MLPVLDYMMKVIILMLPKNNVYYNNYQLGITFYRSCKKNDFVYYNRLIINPTNKIYLSITVFLMGCLKCILEEYSLPQSKLQKVQHY